MEYWKKIRKLQLDSSFYTLAITAFNEHLPDGPDALISAIKATNTSQCHIVAIYHNKSQDKPHYHVLVKMADSHDRMVVSTILRQLHIQFREGIDDNLIKERALETCGSFPHYVTYLLHRTVAAQIEEKAEYQMEDLITNLSSSDICKILDGYSIKSYKVTKKNLPHLLDKARKWGLAQKSFTSFMAETHILWPTPSVESKLRKAYDTGINDSLINCEKKPKLCIQLSAPYSEEVISALQKAIPELKFSTSKGIFTTEIDPSIKSLCINIQELSKKKPEYKKIHTAIETLCDPNNHKIQPPLTPKHIHWTGDTIIFLEKNGFRNKDFFPRISKECFLCYLENNHITCCEPPETKMNNEDKKSLINRYKEFVQGFEQNYTICEETSSITLEDLY